MQNLIRRKILIDSTSQKNLLQRLKKLPNELLWCFYWTGRESPRKIFDMRP